MARNAKDAAKEYVHSWRKTGNSLVNTHTQYRDAILNDPALRAALARYVNNLDLQGQINKGNLSENQALKLFHDAGKDFMRELHREIDSMIISSNQNPINQTDLSNPINMDLQLSIPGSLANIAMNDEAADVAQNYAENIAENQQMQQQQADDMATMQYDSDDEADDTPSNTTTSTTDDAVADLEKGALVVAGLKALDDFDPMVEKEGAKIVEEIFHKITGIDGGSFEGILNDAEADVTHKAENILKPMMDDIKGK